MQGESTKVCTQSAPILVQQYWLSTDHAPGTVLDARGLYSFKLVVNIKYLTNHVNEYIPTNKDKAMKDRWSMVSEDIKWGAGIEA